MLAHASELFGNAFRRQDEIYATAVDGTLRHAVVLGCAILGKRDPAVCFDRGDAERAVGTRARQHGAHGLPSPIFRQGTEEEINGHVVTTFLAAWHDTKN